MAHAEAPLSEDEAHVKRGVELRTSGKNREALEEFQRAYAIHPTPRTRAQIALAFQAIGEWIEAERGLEGALQVKDDPWISRYRAALEGSLAVVRAHLGWLEVGANVEGAELLLNGARRGTMPLATPLRVVAGTVVIEVRAPGYVPSRRSIDVTAENRAREVVTLEREIASPVVAPASSPASRAASPSLGIGSELAHGSASRRIAGIGALGGAVLFAGAGIVAWRVHEWNSDKYNDDSRCLVGTQTRDQNCGGNGTMATTALVLEIGSFALAGVAAGIGTWLLATPSGSQKPTAEAACGPSGGLGIVCRGVF